MTELIILPLVYVCRVITHTKKKSLWHWYPSIYTPYEVETPTDINFMSTMQWHWVSFNKGGSENKTTVIYFITGKSDKVELCRAHNLRALHDFCLCNYFAYLWSPCACLDNKYKVTFVALIKCFEAKGCQFWHCDSFKRSLWVLSVLPASLIYYIAANTQMINSVWALWSW